MPARKVVLIIRDGWGYRTQRKNNIIALAATPRTDALMSTYPTTILKASGAAVGLPEGYQGNSEVGHLTIGSGRIILESFERINRGIKDGSFFSNAELLAAMNNCRKQGSTLHIIGLLQTQAVHSHISHLFAILDMCKKNKLQAVKVHAITDGRDAPVTESIKHIKALQNRMRILGFGEIVTLSGRYYAMDRDKRWKRTKKAYDCIVHGKCKEEFDDALEQAKECHNHKETDEFIVPRKLRGYDGIKQHDSIIFFNFRTDRPRQLTKAMIDERFAGWKRKPLRTTYVAMTQYYEPMNAHVAFKDIDIKNGLGETVSKAGYSQLRTAETEKYAHVTFFFNGQIEKPYRNEDRMLVHSPKVATYDLKPEMSAPEVTDRVVEQIHREKYDLIVMNYANADMVGHTGVLAAIKKAVETVDHCVGMVADNALLHNYSVLILGDHGNAENKTALWRTSHTTNPVPCVLVTNDKALRKCRLRKGGLQDIAPTVLDILGLKKPKEMTGKSLLV